MMMTPQIAKTSSRRRSVKVEENSDPEIVETGQSKSRNNNVIHFVKIKNENVENSSKSVSNGLSSSSSNLPVRKRGRPKKFETETLSVDDDEPEVVELNRFDRNHVFDQEVRIVLQRCDKLVRHWPSAKKCIKPSLILPKVRHDEEKESASRQIVMSRRRNGQLDLSSDPTSSDDRNENGFRPNLKRKLISNETEIVESKSVEDDRANGFSDMTEDVPKKRLKPNQRER